MQQKTSTQQGASSAISQPRAWQGYLSKLIALVALLGGLGVSQQAWGQRFTSDNVTLRLLAGGNVKITTYTGKGTATPKFANADLGNSNQLDISTDSLTIKAAVANINSTGEPITSATFFFRVYPAGTAAASQPAYSQLSLDLTSADNTNSNPVVYATSGQSVDLMSIARTSGGGTYTVDTYYQFHYDDGTDSNDVTDPGAYSTSPYSASFKVKAPTVTPSGGTTTWQSTSSTDWAVATNWSNGVPTLNANAIIPSKTNSTIVYPILNDPTYNYAVKNLILQGNSNSSAGQLTINAATLTIYGNLTQAAGGLTGNTIGNAGQTDPMQNSTVVFAGTDQIITGNLVVSDIIIAGSGTKSVINQLTPSNILAFEPASASNGVIIQSAAQDNTSGTVSTVFDTTGNSYIQLGASAQISTASGQAETLTSYVKGVLRADRNLTANNFNSFGNIGLDITPNHTPGRIYVYRVVGDALTGPINATAVPIKRQYKIVGDDDSGSSGTANSKLNVVFHYLPSTDELNGIDENNLTMFLTQTNGAPYSATDGTLYTAQRIFVRNELPSLTNFTLTLGDKTNPLPVSLVAFGAVRSGANALLTWATASEEKNSGFNVQVSQDGVSFRTLSFVASQSPNSSTTLNYKYTDTEAGKTGIRYYRLEQVDENGTKNYSPVRALNFSSVAAAGTGALVAYPNPFTDGVSLTLDGANAADGMATVKLVDMTGRTIRESKLALVGSSLTLSDMSTLRSGLYLAKVTLPDGTTQTVRISKQ